MLDARFALETTPVSFSLLITLIIRIYLYVVCNVCGGRERIASLTLIYVNRIVLSVWLWQRQWHCPSVRDCLAREW